MRPPRTLLALLLCAALGAAACAAEPANDPVEPAGAPADSGFPVTVTAANGDITIEERPAAIVSLSPTATEILFAVGAGDQVVAVDSNSTFPPEAPITDLQAFEPNVEAIAEHEPDLVVISDDIDDLLASLEALEIPVIHQTAAVTLVDTYAQIEALGAATGRSEGAASLVADMRAEIEALSARAPDLPEPPTYYYELDPTYFSVTSDTFVGEVVGMAGLENIADEVGEDAGGYPQLSAEFVIEADPDLIFLADTKCCDQSAETVAERPGWDQISAVRNGGVVELDDDVASRWGPRVVELLEAAVEAVEDLAA